jgi:hypothetical protein
MTGASPQMVGSNTGPAVLPPQPEAGARESLPAIVLNTSSATRFTTYVTTDPLNTSNSWVVGLSTSDLSIYSGFVAQQFHVLLGTGVALPELPSLGFSELTMLDAINRSPSVNIEAWFSSQRASAPAFGPATDRDASLQEAEWEFLKLTSYLDPQSRRPIQENFSSLIAAIREDPETSDINIDSVRSALQLLGQTKSTVPPQFSLNDDGNLYLQWFDGRDALVGVTFKANGRAVWSASQGDPNSETGRTAEAGERPAQALAELLPMIARWAFGAAAHAPTRR